MVVVLQCLYFNLVHYDLVTDDINDIESGIVTLSAGLCMHLIRNFPI